MNTLHDLPNRSNPEVAISQIVHILEDSLAGQSFADAESSAYQLTNEAVRRILEAQLQRSADSFGAEVEVGAHRYRRYTPTASTVTFHSLSGALTVTRWLHRRVDIRNGPTIDAVALSAGIVEGATPALASSIAYGYAEGDMRHHHATLVAAARRPPSRATLERIAKRVAASIHAQCPAIEQLVRTVLVLPPGTRAMALGLDRTSVPMAELAPNKPPVSRKKPYVRAVPAPIDVNFRMAYVGTVSCVDEEGKALTTWRYSIPACDDPAGIAERMRRDVEAALESNPNLAVGIIQDGAPEMWNVMRHALQPLVDGGILERWEEAIDRYHLLERLKEATAIVCPDRQERERIFGPLIASLDNDDVAIDKIEHRLIKHAKDLKRKDEAVLLEHLTYIENNKDRMRYVGLRLAHLPVGSGVTESTAKVAVKQRANRSGQRWSEHGLRGLLTLRALKLGDRFHAVWKCFAEGYVTPVAQAA